MKYQGTKSNMTLRLGWGKCNLAWAWVAPFCTCSLCLYGPRKRIWIPSLLPQRLRVQLAKKLALSAKEDVGITIVSLVLESGEK